MRDTAWTDLDCLVEDAMKCWGVPGLAVGVVNGDDVILLKGYGTRELGANAPVTCDTQFMICSLTKSITAAGLALLVDEQRLGWDTKVREILPEFQLRDANATEEITVSDLLTHRTGLPAHDRIWSPPGRRSRQQMVDALRYLELSRRLRVSFQYSNLSYVVAGMLAERLSGRSWEQFTTQRLLLPLGFTGFGFSKADLESAADRAFPHQWDRCGVYRGKLWPMQATPAGGINASVADIARWVRFLLSRGRVDGRRLVSQAAIDAMTTPRINAGDSEFAEIGKIHYGYGLTCEHYRGDVTVSHTGSQPGWGALMTMMPAHRIGVVVLTNRDPSPVRELIAYAVFDRLRSLAPLDWFEVFRARRQAALDKEETEEGARTLTHRSDSPLDEPPEDLIGEYEHPAYGRISIVRGASAMHWSWRGLGGMLVCRAQNSFQLKEDGEARYPSGIVISYEKNAEGRVDALRSPLEPAVSDIVFQRRVAGETQ
ncbi:serine hydrolase domain-containing protein [Paraburkholderia oxyphila]|uniref:serine hydrolase domain-containing protein n=1 Tax=Paraburkholderia oxyphila TaxID=614212 RepID=UPI000A03EFC9|nr:serine hydrolase domain-containing protein [Paraburkholderia oxyphila]